MKFLPLLLAGCTLGPTQAPEVPPERPRPQPAALAAQEAEKLPEPDPCAAFEARKAWAIAEADAAAKLAWEQRKAQMRSIGQLAFYQGRVHYWLQHGQPLERATQKALVETRNRKRTPDARIMAVFTARAGC